MTKLRIVPFVVVVIACVGAYLASTGGNHGASPMMSVEQDHHLHSGSDHEAAAYNTVAVDDVVAYVALHQPEATVDTSTLLDDYSWTAEWEVRFIDAHHDGSVLHYAHAMHRHHRDQRLVAHWDFEHGTWSDWQRLP